jgi:hypothetical protein
MSNDWQDSKAGIVKFLMDFGNKFQQKLGLAIWEATPTELHEVKQQFGYLFDRYEQWVKSNREGTPDLTHTDGEICATQRLTTTSQK